MISKKKVTHGLTHILIILGSDKTTILVATGQNDYWPLYISTGNIHNNVQCAHFNGILLLGFLANPKSAKSCPPLYSVTWIDWLLNIASKEHSDDPRLAVVWFGPGSGTFWLNLNLKYHVWSSRQPNPKPEPLEPGLKGLNLVWTSLNLQLNKSNFYFGVTLWLNQIGSCTSLLLPSLLSPFTPTPIPLQKQCKS